MGLGLTLRVLWYDQDVLELDIRIWNGDFGGHADVYCEIDGLRPIANRILGFPKGPADSREVTLGSLERKYAGGGVTLRFHCVDGAGHGYVEATIDSNCEFGGTTQTAVVAFPVEAAAIDDFVRKLLQVDARREGSAHLAAKL